MTREVYPDNRFIRFSRSQVFIRVFEDTEPQGARLADRFQVDGFPTLIVLDSTGHEVDRIEGAMSAPDLIEELQVIFRNAKNEKITL